MNGYISSNIFLKNINKNQLEKLDETFNLSSNGNAEILCVWFLISIKADYRPAFDPMKTFLTKIGRRKFLQPIYEELAKNPVNKNGLKKCMKRLVIITITYLSIP